MSYLHARSIQFLPLDWELWVSAYLSQYNASTIATDFDEHCKSLDTETKKSNENQTNL
jgi:hypothetical protein